MKAGIHKVIRSSYVDGPGHRTVVFFQGCARGCDGCQSPHLWATDGGYEVEVGDLVNQLLAEARQNQAGTLNITVSGGEPFEQPQALSELVSRLKAAGAHIIIYTGYTYEQLQGRGYDEALAGIDVLVDGPYISQMDSAGMQYRGSSNQRPLDLTASRERGELVVLDWDTPELILTHDGRILATGPMVDLLASWGLDESVVSRRCGQTANADPQAG